MFVKEKFIKRLKTLRKTKGVSTRKLGGAIGVSSPAISQFENGGALPALDTLVALADYFDVSVDYLLGVSDERKPASRPEERLEYTHINKPGIVKEQTEGKYGKRGQANKKPGQNEIDKLIEELDEESVTELKKYAEYLKVRQTLDSNKDERSAGLDGDASNNK